MRQKTIKEGNKFEDVTLTMIVRDEVINPAGGIYTMLKDHAAYYPEVVVLDTGSVDGTKDILEHLSSKFGNIRVYHNKFEGYVRARNTANSHVKTKYTLVLDADERLPSSNHKSLKTLMRDFPFLPKIKIPIYEIRPGLNPIPDTHCWVGRLRQSKMAFQGNVYESEDVSFAIKASDVAISHFRPSKKLEKNKRTLWYTPLTTKVFNGKNNLDSHAQVLPFAKWKIPDPNTLEKFAGVNIFEVIKELTGIGISIPNEALEGIKNFSFQ